MMTEALSSSADDFTGTSDEAIINMATLQSENEIHRQSRKSDPFIDSRRRLEARLAERQLAKDIQEFDFDC